MHTVIETGVQQIAVDRLEIRARRRLLVSAFSWSHSAGTVAWIMGENGTGKSSLLRVLAGCDSASAGTVRWPHTPFEVGYYTPDMSVPHDFAVRAWLELVGTLHSDVEVLDQLDELRPETDARRRFKDLSTGEAKRLLLWGVLRPLGRALILDEPYEHLSPDAKAILTSALRAIARTSVVIVATNQEIARAQAEPLLVLNGTDIEMLP